MRVSYKIAYIYLLLTMTFWAGNSITARMFADDLPPLQHTHSGDGFLPPS